MDDIEARLIQVEKEVAELKRQLEVRPTNKDFDGSEWVLKVVMDAMKSNRGRLLEVLRASQGQKEDDKPTMLCNWIGCNKEATTQVRANDGTDNVYPSCSDHQDQMGQVITKTGTYQTPS